VSDNFACLNDCLQSQRGRATLPTSFRRPSNGDSFLSPGFAASAFQFGQFEGKRRVASFGFPYDYALQTVKEVEAFGGPSARIRQVLCTGVGIGGHRDNPHFNEIYRWDPPASSDSANAPARHGSYVFVQFT
jgi:hypothetical protein